MFFPEVKIEAGEEILLYNQAMMSEREVDTLLAPYYTLDPDEFIEGNENLACFKKFSNKGNGVPPEVIEQLEKLATGIINGQYEPQKMLLVKVIDLLTLYSNHLDQQLYSINPKPSIAEKQRLVALFLNAAYKLSPKIDPDFLELYNPRILSTTAQLLFYLGKALRYEGVSVEERLSHLKNAFKIAEYLELLKCGLESDPHAYQNRLPSYRLPISYGYQEQKKWKEAAQLMLSDVDSEKPVTSAQAAMQVALIYKKQHEEEGTGIEGALKYAHFAVKRSKESDSSIVDYNARTCLMQVLHTAEEHEEASKLAQTMIDEMDANPNCGAKPDHRSQAEKILAANHQALLHA